MGSVPARHSCIAIMHGWVNKLVFDALGFKKSFEHGGAFVVQAVIARTETYINEALMEFFECVKQALGSSVFEGLDENGIAVIIV